MAGDGHAHLLSNIMDQRTPLLGLEGGGRPSAAADGIIIMYVHFYIIHVGIFTK